jgi:hypothetical protein
MSSDGIHIRARFTLRQMFLSISLFGLGLGGIVFWYRGFQLPFDPKYDWFARGETLWRTIGLVVGWTLVCIAIILLLAKRRRARLLIWTLIGIIPGAVFGAYLRDLFGERPPAWGKSGDPYEIWIPLGMALGSLALLAFAMLFARSGEE